MAVSKEVQRNIVKAVIIAIVILIFLQPSLFPQPIQQITYQIREIFDVVVLRNTDTSNVVNQGVAMKAVVVDANGNVLQELATIKYNEGKPLTIVTKESGTGFLSLGAPPTCTGGCLAFQTTLDNTAGDAEVTITGVTADNKCSWDNPLYSDPECTGLPNILGPSGVGNGDLDNLWQTEIGSGGACYPGDTDNGDGTCTKVLQDADTENLDDGWVDEQYGGFGTDANINVGEGDSGDIENMRSMITFDISSFSGTDTIVSATMSLYCYASNSGGAVGGINVHDITSVWSEESLSYPGPSYNPSVIDSNSQDGTIGWHVFDVSSDVSSSVGTDTDVSYYLIAIDESTKGYNQFRTKEHTTSSERPKLEIIYNKPSSGIILPQGEVYPESGSVTSDPLDLSLIDEGLINFTMSATGTYLDAQGQPQILTAAGGNLILGISAQQCSDGTEADATLANDAPLYCSTVNEGQYCRVDAYGITTLIDYASYCGCEAGWYALGDVCVPITDCRDTWGATSCEPNGIRYCNSDGSITNECILCDGDGLDDTWGTGDDNCPKNANSDYANGCQPDTNSECVYPAAAGAGFIVDIPPPTIDPITRCGDGVKNGDEDCDGTDFGGETCLSLSYEGGGVLLCSVGCNYILPGDCITHPIKFRTSSRDYPSTVNPDNWIAYADKGCELIDLTGYGYDNTLGKTSASCDTYHILGTKVINDINTGFKEIFDLIHLDHPYVDPTGDEEISVHSSGNYVYLCEDDPGNNRIAYYRYSSLRSNNAETSPTPTTGYEVREFEC